ncbi:MAG: SDR family NAD(P)-dependent oxidoreductase [Bryobacteraceae bacterium]
MPLPEHPHPRRVLVTGAAKRIGRAIALDLSRSGFQVAIHYSASRAEAEELSRLCNGAPIFQADLTKVDEIRRMFREVGERFGLLDCLVNNAGRFTGIDPLKVTEADWDFILDVNLKAVFFCCQEGARQMNERGAGRIVNISSLGGLIPWAEHVPYCASKAGAVMLTKALAKAFAPRITVNSVAPGVIMFAEEGPPSKAVLDATPMHRTGKAEEVAEAVRFFLTAPDFITAQILAVDGGLSQR